MLLNTFRAEFTKLRTTRSFWWTSGIFLVFAWGWAALVAAFTSAGLEGISSINVAVVPVGVQYLGFAVLMIQAIMVVTTEYRYGMQSVTLMSNPNRFMVAACKLLLYGFIAALLTLVGVAGAFLIADWMAKGVVAEMFDPFNDDIGRRLLWTFPVGAAALVMFAQGLGLLLRQTAGAVSVGLIFFLGIDQFILFLPKIGEKLVHYSPFRGMGNWITDYAPGDAPWGDSVTAYGAVFLAWALVLWVGGLINLMARDA